MAVSSSIDFKGTFVLGTSGSTPTFTLEDITPYSGEGISTSNVKGIITVVGPDGSAFYQNLDFNSPDIQPASSTTKSGINLPTVGGKVVPGNYTATYTIQVSGGVQAGTYVKTKSFTYGFVAPVISISITANCLSATLTSVDSTSYSVQAIVPTITRTHTVNYQDPITVPQTSDSTQQILITSPNFWTGRYTTDITSVLSYSFPNNWYITVTINGNKFFDVNCDTNLCSISCGVKALNQRYINATTNNPELAEELLCVMNRVSFLMNLFNILITCGYGDDANTVLGLIKTEGNFTDDCCGSGERQIVPITSSSGGSSIVYAVTAGNGISVTTTTGTGSVSWAVAMQASLLNKLNAITNATVVAGSDKITVSSNTSGYNVTYTIDLGATIPSPPNTMAFEAKINSATAIQPTVGSFIVSGGLLSQGLTITAKTGSPGDPARFLVQSLGTFSAYTALMQLFVEGEAEPTFKANIIDKNSTQFEIEFTDMLNTPLTYSSFALALTNLGAGKFGYLSFWLTAKP